MSLAELCRLLCGVVPDAFSGTSAMCSGYFRVVHGSLAWISRC